MAIQSLKDFIGTSKVVSSSSQKLPTVDLESRLNPQTVTQSYGIAQPAVDAVKGLGTLYGGGEQGIANKLKQDIQAGASDIQQGNVAKGVVKSGLRTAGDVAGAVYAPIGAAIQSTGIGKVFDKIGELSQMGGKYNPINAITDLKSVQDFVSKHPNLEEDFGRALNLALAATDSSKIEPSTIIERTKAQFSGAKPVTVTPKSLEQQNYDTAVQIENSQIANAGNNTMTGAQIDQMHVPTQEFTAPKAQSVISKTGSKLGLEPAVIMNRVARLKPTDALKFEKMSGKTQGEYLSETGNFGTPDTIIKNEATKFVESKNSVDSELAKLPGVYKDGSITDALSGLLERANMESGTNVKSPYLNQVENLIKKNEGSGLTMPEINDVKRLYEKNVKLGYDKKTESAKVNQATNIDSAIREWQVTKAKELGFNNISDLNKQTQISKFIIDKLGSQIVGQNGLNGINLTDWIILGGGDPTAVASFLTKKFFSSKAVQSKIAELLNKNKDVKGLIKPDTSITGENIKRTVSPEGLLGLPPASSEFKTTTPSMETIKVAPSGTQTEIISGKGVSNSSKQTPQPQSKAIKSSSSKGIFNFPNKQGGFINLKAISKAIDNTDKNIMTDFIEGGGKSEATDLAVKMGLPSAFKGDQALKNDFIKILDYERAATKAIMDKSKKGSPTVGKTVDSALMKEAKKYKSAEEFVRAQPIVYHGSSKNLKQFSNKQGTFFTNDMMNAEGYAGGNNVYEGYLNINNPLVIDAKGALHRELDTKWGKTTQEIVNNVDKKKYDGVIFKNIKDSWIDDAEVDTPSTIYYAFNPKDAFLNESQLVDLYNKAVGKK